MNPFKYLLKRLTLIIKEPDSSYAEGALAVLIKRAENRMKIRPSCSYCGTKMAFRTSKISGGGIASPVGSPIRDDQMWKCPVCFAGQGFGVPITREEAMEEIRLRGSRYLARPTIRTDEAMREDVKQRLRKLGYLDFGDGVISE